MNEDILYFSHNADNIYPGYAENEHINNIKNYNALYRVKDWRKMLCNSWISPFSIDYDGKELIRYNTVEHMIQASKINISEIGNNIKSYNFTLNSGSKLGKGDGLDVIVETIKNRNNYKMDKIQLQKWDMIKDNITYIALYNKFTQNEHLKEMLIYTGTSQLWLEIKNKPSVRQYMLEIVRANILASLNLYTIITLNNAMDMISNDEIVNYLIEDRFQSLLNLDSNGLLCKTLNKKIEMISLCDIYGKLYLVKAIYDQNTKTLENPDHKISKELLFSSLFK